MKNRAIVALTALAIAGSVFAVAAPAEAAQFGIYVNPGYSATMHFRPRPSTAA